MDKLEIMELVFNLCAYHHPENIDLPTGYTPPTLAITNLYWKGWGLLLVLCAHNPETIGAEAWNMYPTLHVLMEMCITNHFIFPTPVEELQMITLEKQAILQFEVHLAAASTKVSRRIFSCFIGVNGVLKLSAKLSLGKIKSCTENDL